MFKIASFVGAMVIGILQFEVGSGLDTPKIRLDRFRLASVARGSVPCFVGSIVLGRNLEVDFLNLELLCVLGALVPTRHISFAHFFSLANDRLSMTPLPVSKVEESPRTVAKNLASLLTFLLCSTSSFGMLATTM